MSTKNNSILPQEIYMPLFELIYYIIINARNLIEEPKLYGPLRMLEIARRLLNILSSENIELPIKTEDFIKNVEITKNSIIEGEESFVTNLDNLVNDVISFLTNNQREENK